MSCSPRPSRVSDELITEARERSTGMVHEAQQRKASILDELTSAKNLLERKIEELRSFEKDYRGRLKGFISEQLEKPEAHGCRPGCGTEAEGDAEDDAQQSLTSAAFAGWAFAPPLRVSAGGFVPLWCVRVVCVGGSGILCRTALARHHVIDDEMRIRDGCYASRGCAASSRLSLVGPQGREQRSAPAKQAAPAKKAATAAKKAAPAVNGCHREEGGSGGEEGRDQLQ